MVARPFPRQRPAPKRKGPPRFVLVYMGGPAPKDDAALIAAVPGLKVVASTDNVFLVEGLKDLAAVKAALPSLRKPWVFGNETFYQPAGA